MVVSFWLDSKGMPKKGERKCFKFRILTPKYGGFRELEPKGYKNRQTV
jgi:hypothetical protein